MCVPKLRFKADDGSEFPEWEERRLGDVCDIVGGGTPDTEKSEYWNEDINWFTPSEIGTTKYAVKSSRQISKLGILKSSAKLLPRGTILLTSRATLGEMAITRQECCTNQGFQSLIIKPGYLNEFIYYCQSVIKKYCKKHASGSTFLEIGKKEISECKLGIPSLPEQRKIAAFLSAIDTHLELSRSELSKWEQFKKGMLQKIFHQEIRFRAEDGSVYPEREEKKLGEVLKKYKKFSPKNNLYIHVSLTKEGVVPKTDRYNRDFLVTQDNKKYRVTHLNDICYNPANLKFGVICRNKYGDGIFSPIYVTFQITKEVLAYFIELIVTNESFIKRVLQYQEGTVYERMAVAVEDFIKMSVSIPSLPEQQKIADLFSSIDQMIEHAKQEVEYWELYKKGLLQQMFV